MSKQAATKTAEAKAAREAERAKRYPSTIAAAAKGQPTPGSAAPAKAPKAATVADSRMAYLAHQWAAARAGSMSHQLRVLFSSLPENTPGAEAVEAAMQQLGANPNSAKKSYSLYRAWLGLTAAAAKAPSANDSQKRAAA